MMCISCVMERLEHENDGSIVDFYQCRTADNLMSALMCSV